MLQIYHDPARWGVALYMAARARGMAAGLFSRADEVEPGSRVFVHMHNNPKVRGKDKQLMAQLARRADIRLIPTARDAVLYDDKVEQFRQLAEWMPPTWLHERRAAAMEWLEAAAYPFISKSAAGSASHNVRLIEDRQAAEREIHYAFENGGIPVRGGARQSGYLLWQKFLPQNLYDYRVIIIGSKRLILRRWNRDDVPFASGSGRLEPITELDDGTVGVLLAADRFFASEGFRWCGIDLVQDPDDGAWYVLETTVGWALQGYVDCLFFGDAQGRTGAHLWEIFLDELETGIFDG